MLTPAQIADRKRGLADQTAEDLARAERAVIALRQKFIALRKEALLAEAAVMGLQVAAS